MKIAVILAIVLSVPAFLFSSTLHVPADHATIQAAIDAAAGGDTVLVAPGTYAEQIDFLGKAITVMSSGGAEVTTIEGGGYGTGSVVTIASGEGPDSVIHGFTITNGHVLLTGGGGIRCDQTSPVIRNNIIINNSGGDIYFSGIGGGIESVDGSPLIMGNTITSNSVSSHYGGSYGGGLHLSGGSPVVKDNIITENAANYGGGISAGGTDAVIANNIIDHNHGGFGGGIHCTYCDITIEDNIITHNSSHKEWGYGGGIRCSNASPLIRNNIIAQNHTEYEGGGIYCWNSSPLIVNNVICDNAASNFLQYSGGGGIYCYNKSDPVVVNTVLWDNSADMGPEIFLENVSHPSTLSIRHSIVEGGQASAHLEANCILHWGAGMIDADPLFVDLAGEDYHITYLSPCRGSGDSSVSDLPPFDFEGDPRICQSTVDIGADEFYTHLYCSGDFTPGGQLEAKLSGLPGTNPVVLFIGSGLLSSPVQTMWGAFHLQAPWIMVGPLVPIPGNGVLILPFSLPKPCDLPMQGLIGLYPDSLTNPYVLKVQ